MARGSNSVLQRRHANAGHKPHDGVFLTRDGTWQQVNNVERRWRQIRKDTGLDRVTPHTFRKTVATLISERVDAETASPQLDHFPAITREFYVPKPAVAADVAPTSRRSWLTLIGATARILREQVGSSAVGFNGRTGPDPAFPRSEPVLRSG